MVLRAGNARIMNVKLHEELDENNERILFLNYFPFFSQHKDNMCSLQTYKQEYLNTYHFTNQRKSSLICQYWCHMQRWSLIYLAANVALQKNGMVTMMPFYIVCRAVPVATLPCFIRIIQSYRFSTSFLKVTVYLKYVIKPASFFLYVVSLLEKERLRSWWPWLFIVYSTGIHCPSSPSKVLSKMPGEKA